MTSPCPRRALLPKALSRPPMTAVGSSPARSSIRATIDVVVVLPCAPPMAIPVRRSRISSASISALAITGTPRRRASTISGLSCRAADVTTTTSASPMLSPACPSCTRTPIPASRRVMSVSTGIGPAHLVAQVDEQFGDATHADAADADEVDATRGLGHGQWLPCISDSARAAITSAASGRARPRARVAMAWRRSSSANSPRSSVASRSPVRSSSSSITAAPAASSVRALARW